MALRTEKLVSAGLCDIVNLLAQEFLGYTTCTIIDMTGLHRGEKRYHGASLVSACFGTLRFRLRDNTGVPGEGCCDKELQGTI